MRPRPLHGWLLILPVLLLLASAGAAQPGEEPAPSPTDASAAAAQRVRLERSAPLPEGVDREEARRMAREAALLQAWRDVAEEALLWRWALDKDVLIDAAHPHWGELGWVLGSQVLSERVADGRVTVVVESPPVGDLSALSRPRERSLSRDLDGDGQAETVAVGLDGRVYVLRGEQVAGSTPGLSSLVSTRGKGPDGRTFDRIRLARLVAVDTAEPAGKGRARVVARLAVAEAVDGHYAGSATERQEILVSLAGAGEGPTIDLEEPNPRQPPVLRGRVVAPAGLRQVVVSLNGQDLWRSPASLSGGRELQLDVLLDLKPGPNQAVLTVKDRQDRTAEARVALEGPPPAARARGPLRALVVGIDRYPGGGTCVQAQEDARRVAAALGEGGPEEASVRTLLGAEATGAALREALETLAGEAQSGDRVVFYFAGLSSVGQAADGKLLLPGDSPSPESGLSAEDLATWARSLPSVQLLVVLDTADPGDAGVDERWLEGADFLAALAAPGRTLLATGDPSPEARVSGKAAGGLLTSSLLEAWRGQADYDGDGRTSAEETYRLAVTAAARRLQELEEPPAMPLLRGDGGAPLGD